MKVYKVVRKTKNGLRSCIVDGRIKDLCLKYEIGKETKPKVGKIFVFKSFKYANSFRLGNFLKKDSIVLECKTSAVSKPRNMERVGNIILRDVIAFWKGEVKSWNLSSTPMGTYLAKKITPIREIG